MVALKEKSGVTKMSWIRPLGTMNFKFPKVTKVVDRLTSTEPPAGQIQPFTRAALRIITLTVWVVSRQTRWHDGRLTRWWAHTHTCRLHQCPACSGLFVSPPNCLQVWANTEQNSCRWNHTKQESQLRNRRAPSLVERKRKREKSTWTLRSFYQNWYKHLGWERAIKSPNSLGYWDFILWSEKHNVYVFVEAWSTRCLDGSNKYRNMLYSIHLEGLFVRKAKFSVGLQNHMWAVRVHWSAHT